MWVLDAQNNSSERWLCFEAWVGNLEIVHTNFYQTILLNIRYSLITNMGDKRNKLLFSQLSRQTPAVRLPGALHAFDNSFETRCRTSYACCYSVQHLHAYLCSASRVPWSFPPTCQLYRKEGAILSSSRDSVHPQVNFLSWFRSRRDLRRRATHITAADPSSIQSSSSLLRTASRLRSNLRTYPQVILWFSCQFIRSFGILQSG